MNRIIKYWKPLLTVSLWGSSFVATKILLSELSPLAIIFLRQVFGSVFLTCIAVYSKRSFIIDKKNLTGIIILSLVAVFHLWIQVTGMKYTTASNTGWIIGISPVFMAFIGVFYFKEKLNLMKLMGILTAFTGLILLISKGDIRNVNLISNKGDFLILASAFTWGIYSAVNKKITLTFSPFMIILFSFIIMTAITSPFIINTSFIISLKNLSLNSWLAIIYLGIFVSGIAYVLWAQALKEMESSKAGVFIYIEPFITVLTARVVLNENITMLAIISGLIITAGVIIVNKN